MNNETIGSTLNETITNEGSHLPQMSYDEKMKFLLSIRNDLGLEGKPVEQFTDETPKGKYLEVYSMGNI